MSHYSRIFCTASIIPSLATAIGFANSNSDKCKLALNEETTDIYSNGSMRFELKYKNKRDPITVELNKADDVDPVGHAEINEFITDIGFAGFSSSKRKVIHHLKNTNFIVACEHPEDLDEDGENLIQHFLQYFIEHCNGLFHIDGEGFYNRQGQLLLPDN